MVETARRPSRAMKQGLALIGAPALVALFLLAYNNTSVAPQLRKSQELVSHTLEVIAIARAFDLAVGNAESAERGFIITGDTAYLEAYKTNTQDMSQRLVRLRALTQDNPDQQRRMALIDSAIEGKLSE